MGFRGRSIVPGSLFYGCGRRQVENFNFMHSLRRHPYRYSYIKKRLGDVTNTMLSKSLQELEKDGILNRKQYPEIPPRVEYSLTEKGLSLIPVIVCMGKWGLESCGEEKEKVYCKPCKSK